MPRVIAYSCNPATWRLGSGVNGRETEMSYKWCINQFAMVRSLSYYKWVTSTVCLARNHSFCSPRWGVPNDYSPSSSHPPSVGAIRQASADGSISHFVAPRQAGAQPEVRPTATWPRTPKPQKSVASSPGSPSSARRNVRAAGSGDASVNNGRDRDACRPSFYMLKR